MGQLSRSRRILRERGPVEVIRRGVRELGVVAAYRELGRTRTFESSAELVRFAETIGGGVVAPFQITSEIASLLDRIRAQQPRVLLEIGTANGGTLLLFAHSAHPQATIVSVDLDGYPVWRIPIYNRFALPGQTMHLLRADSHDPGTRARVEELLDGRKIDFLFIDGDHSDTGVRSDFELFYDLMRPGGLIGFHNILDDHDACQVRLLWNELRTHHSCEELVADPSQGRRGIGLLHVE